MNIKKILVYSNGELIGDAIYKLNFLFNLKKNFPKSKIIWLVANKTAYETVLKKISEPYIDQIISIGYGKKFWSDLIFMPKVISNLDVDIIIDTQKSFFRSILVKKIRHKIMLTDSLNGLLSNIKKTSSNQKFTLNEQLIDYISRLKKNLNSKPIYKNFELNPKRNIELIVEKLFSKQKKYIGYSVSAGDKAKVWPIKNFIYLANHFSNKGFIPVFFIGPGEEEIFKHLRKQVPNALFPESEIRDKYNELNGFGVEVVSSIANRMDICLANDSGTGHMIALSNTHLISLFLKHNPKKYMPLAKSLTIIDSNDFKKTGVTKNIVKKVMEKLLTNK